MEKFINIANSIENLKAFKGYEIVRIDLQLNKNDHQFHAFLELEWNNQNSPAGTANDRIEIEILPNGSFIEF